MTNEPKQIATTTKIAISRRLTKSLSLERLNDVVEDDFSRIEVAESIMIVSD